MRENILASISPDTVENITVGKDSNVEVRRQNSVKPPDLLVPEESVRHPDLAGVGHRQILDLPWNTAEISGYNFDFSTLVLR